MHATRRLSLTGRDWATDKHGRYVPLPVLLPVLASVNVTYPYNVSEFKRLRPEVYVLSKDSVGLQSLQYLGYKVKAYQEKYATAQHVPCGALWKA
jgi:hypothetical protein